MDRAYPPREFARMVGRSVSTLRRWDREGKLPAKRTASNQRYYTYDDYCQVLGREPRERKTYSYLRVSSPAQRPDLANQRAAVEQFCIASGKEVAEYMEDVGSSLNYKRKHFLRLMEMVERGEVAEIIIATKTGWRVLASSSSRSSAQTATVGLLARTPSPCHRRKRW